MELIMKIAVFCHELGDTTLLELARNQNSEGLFQRAVDALRAGDIAPALEADLDALDHMVKQETGQRLFPVTRGYSPLPKYPSDPLAQWWTCPGYRCAGRGRVKPGQQAPLCGVTGEELIPGPLSE
jgi:hypothetical protein